MFRFLATQFYRLLAATSKHPIPTQAGTFSVMRRRVVEVILANADRSPYFPGLRAWAGYRQKGLPLQRDGRYAGSSKVGFGGLLRLAVNAVFSYSDIPMRLMFLFASVVLVVSTLAALTIRRPCKSYCTCIAAKTRVVMTIAPMPPNRDR